MSIPVRRSARSASTPTITLTPKMRLVFDGDSMTHRRCGAALDTWPYLHLMNWQVTWADEVSRLLFCWRPELALQFNNAAVAGSSIRDLVRRFDTFIKPLKPQLVLTTVGTNDSAQAIPLPEFKALTTSYIQSVQALGARIIFLIGFPGLDLKPRANCHRHLAMLERVARAQGADCLQVGPDLVAAAKALQRQWPGHTIFSDGIHLNEVGATIVAGSVLKALR
jgi:hypothetical protein